MYATVMNVMSIIIPESSQSGFHSAGKFMQATNRLVEKTKERKKTDGEK